MLSVIYTLLAIGRGSPIDSCIEQSECLALTVGSCDSSGHRTVCLQWEASAACGKASDANSGSSVSHACVGEGGGKDVDGDGSEDWFENTPLCTTVFGGENAIFGVKDGSGCSQAGVYDVSGFDISCNGPQNVCDGNNIKECQWTVPTEPCGTPPLGPVCPDDLVCNVYMPCETVHNDLTCPCSEYKFVSL